ncbi:DUF6542 domain-containing protein [Streptomyces hebeiensis]
MAQRRTHQPQRHPRPQRAPAQRRAMTAGGSLPDNALPARPLLSGPPAGGATTGRRVAAGRTGSGGAVPGPGGPGPAAWSEGSVDGGRARGSRTGASSTRAGGPTRTAAVSRRRGAAGPTRPRGLPNPRFTGLGAGLFATATMLFCAYADQLLFDGAQAVYGAMFLPVSAVTALWVRPADLVTAPISVPIAFAVGALPIAGGAGGFGGHTMALVTTLAVHAGWLYGGTLVAGLIATVRKVQDMGRRQRAREAAATRAAVAAFRASRHG